MSDLAPNKFTFLGIDYVAIFIHKQNSKDNNIYEDSKRLYELAVIYNFLSNSKKDSEWTLHEARLQKTLQNLNLNSIFNINNHLKLAENDFT